MQTLLERLDIHPKVQSFFKPHCKIACGTLTFQYGNAYEHAGTDFHQVPTTEEIWTAGGLDFASHIFVAGSAMDAIAWLDLNHAHYRQLTSLFFISTGSVPHKPHAEIIQKYAPKRKLHFLFSNDPLGSLCDLKLASFLRHKPLKISYHENCYQINFEHKHYAFERLSLNALEKASGYNFLIRTHKPKKTGTYYEQLRNRHPT